MFSAPFYRFVYSLYLLFLCSMFLISCEKKTTPIDNIFIISANPAQWYAEPTWSPDSIWIAFTFYKTFPESICFIQSDGTEFHRITRGSNPDFSPDGENLALNVGDQIYVYNLLSNQLDKITHYRSNFYPDWSPDGKRIAYDSNYKDSLGANVIWLMDMDGNNKKDISIHGVGEWRQPDWFNNFHILHIRYVGHGAPDIFYMDSTGTSPFRLTNEGYNTYPKISPDGNKIIWQRTDQGKINIYIMNSDGSGKYLLIHGGKEAAWSPDGSKIVYWKEGIYTPGEPWDKNDPKVRGSLWVYDLITQSSKQIHP